MKKSRIAILIIAIVVICTAIGVSFAAYNSSQMKDSITIGSGDRVGINVDIGDRAYFADEKGAKLVPKGALILRDSNGVPHDSITRTENAGTPQEIKITNQTALMGRIKLNVTGALVNTLQFTVKNIMCGTVPADDYLEIVFLRNYTSSFNKYVFVNNMTLPTNENGKPHYLGAEWNEATKNFEGGSKLDTQTKKPLGINAIGKPHDFTMIVYFKLDAESMPDNLSNASITFDLLIEAI